jgi:hypothetical protein
MRPDQEDAGGVASPRSELCYGASDRGRKAACCFHVLLDREHAEVIEFYSSRDVADQELAEILHDEPDWDGTVRDRGGGFLRGRADRDLRRLDAWPPP